MNAESSTRSAPRWTRWGAPVALLLGSASIYLASPERALLDSKFSLLTSEALLTRGTLDLLPYFPGLTSRLDQAQQETAPDEAPGEAAREDDPIEERGGERERVTKIPYQLRVVDQRLVYHYPIGTSLLSVPLFAVQKLFGDSSLDASGRYVMRRELRLQAQLAALLSGAAVVLAYFLARRELPTGGAAIVALAAAFGSGLWSVASRVLWNHTWTIVLLSAALVELLRWEDGAKRRPALLGALLAAAFWVRPTNAFSAAAFAIYVALRHRTALARLIATGAAGLALYLGFAQAVFGTWFPAYFRHVVPGGTMRPLRAFAGQLLSAEHGLLVFSPVLLVVAFQLLRCGVAPERRGVAALSLGMVAWYVAYHCWRSRWWGEGSVGPRFLSDVTPYLVWLGAHAWRRARERPLGSGLARWAVRTATALLILAGVAAHAKGVLPIRPGEPQNAPRNVRRARTTVSIGSSEYFAKLPQPQTVRWLSETLLAPAQDQPRKRRSPRDPASRG